VPLVDSNITLAQTDAGLRPLADIGAGAFSYAQPQTGDRSGLLAALPVFAPPVMVLPVPDAHGGAMGGNGAAAGFIGGVHRTSPAVGSAVLGGAAFGSAVLGSPAVACADQPDQKQFNPTTRISPVIPGVLGPHPAREPDPV
jgi:hypothetical protein